MPLRSEEKPRFRPDKLVDFLEAAYCLESDEETWLAQVAAAGRTVWGRTGPVQATICDASDVRAFRIEAAQLIDFCGQSAASVMQAVDSFTPELVARTFRSLLADRCREASSPELNEHFQTMTALGLSDVLGINGLDPVGPLVFLGFWMTEAFQPPPNEMAMYRRMAHHLGAAHRCRRRLRADVVTGSALDATHGAEAILNARLRVVHASGAAATTLSQHDLIETAKLRDRARTRRAANADESAHRWRPMTGARWTLVDHYERDGARYIVARENQSQLRGLEVLSERERQAVAYLAIGQSTKETAYALGISDTTVRVLLSRAAAKLKVKSRAGLLEHPEVKLLRPYVAGSDD